MSTATSNAELTAPPTQRSSLRGGADVFDKVYDGTIFAASLAVPLIIAAIALLLAIGAGLAIHRFGLRFLIDSTWDPSKTMTYGANAFICGTLYSSFWALVIAVPVSIGAAIFLSELSPRRIRTPLTFLIEMLAAIPSVVYGIWGICVLSPWLRDHIEHPVHASTFRDFFLFRTTVNGIVQPLTGSDMLGASVILAIMVTPFITSVSRDILKAIPRVVRDGSYALGATQWETISGVVLPYARAGIIGAVILGLGRALGETMAVTMLIGNSNKPFTPSLMVPGATMASSLANNFANASSELERSAFIEVGLVLFIVTLVVNGCARVLVTYTAKDILGGTRK